eukprot:Ihof_evm1s921 gene=Ihof_evmTU1s921
MGFTRLIVASLTVLPTLCFGWAPGDYSIDLNVLVVYKDHNDLTIPRLVLEGFNTLWSKAEASKLPKLENPTFSAIVIANDKTMSDYDMQNIRKYAKQYDIRVVHLNPSDQYMKGISIPKKRKNYKYTVFDNSEYAYKVADVVNSTAGYLAPAPLNPRQGTIKDTENNFPLLRYGYKPNPNKKERIAAYISTLDGVEQMYFLFDATQKEIDFDEVSKRDDIAYERYHEYTESNLAYGTMWFTWVTRGMWVGQRRLHLNVQVDDLFLASDIYNGKNPDKTEKRYNFRMDEYDCKYNLQLQESITKQLAFNSSIVFELAYNGLGWIVGQDYSFPYTKKDGLVDCMKENRNSFHWVSHTLTHKHLDWKNADECQGKENECPETAFRLNKEFGLNFDFMAGRKVVVDEIPSLTYQPIPSGNMFYNDPEGYDKHHSILSLVTPEISGLVPLNYTKVKGETYPKRIYGRPRNLDAMDAFQKHDIYFVVGDNSRYELLSKNNHHGLYTNFKRWGLEGLLIVNRRTSVIDYDMSLPKEVLQSYIDFNLCPYTSGLPCKEFLKKKLTFDRIIDREIKSHVPYLLQYNVDPIMFHQANLRIFDHEGEDWSLVGLWTKSVLERLEKYLSGLPVISLKMDHLGQYVAQRMARNYCQLQAKLVVRKGVPSLISVKPSKKCPGHAGVKALVSFAESSSTVPRVKYGQN